mmetsp:Transcript_3137/g.6539  ORF Transcript_3137/g.6539 Transcript_3137/m.6539 type:complete len:282 (-) Transcript_3137:138-983(-)
MSSSSHILRAITMPTSPLDGLSPRLWTQLQVWQRNSGSVVSADRCVRATPGAAPDAASVFRAHSLMSLLRRVVMPCSLMSRFTFIVSTLFSSRNVVLYPTNCSYPSVLAALKRMTASCWSIWSPYCVSRREPLLPTTAQVLNFFSWGLPGVVSGSLSGSTSTRCATDLRSLYSLNFTTCDPPHENASLLRKAFFDRIMGTLTLSRSSTHSRNCTPFSPSAAANSAALFASRSASADPSDRTVPSCSSLAGPADHSRSSTSSVRYRSTSSERLLTNAAAASR